MREKSTKLHVKSLIIKGDDNGNEGALREKFENENIIIK